MHIEGFKPLKPFSFDGNLAINWKHWKQQLTIYLKATGRESKEDTVKIATLLHVLGEEVQDLFFTMDISEEEGKKYDGVVKCLESYFLPRTNQSVERHKFNNSVQEDALRCLSTNCGYKSLRDDLIKDRIECGVRHTSERLIPTLTLAKAAQAAEQTHKLTQAIDSKEAVGLRVLHRSNRTEGNTSGTLAGDREGYEYGTSHCKTRGNHNGSTVHNTNQAHSNKWGLPEQPVHH
ncbi:hypothetical protein PR048_020998 [Dryococelus australis]|uniref:Uncharacterized protein n=1 Tax=Dryococelus australis TaxID=614101 RepID=A0ABQ9GX00_9NEOP|nr:hypothetical protein PR048_020998 [Dryococelus australis]